MPDTEISRLPELPASSVVTEDVLAIVDVSVSETKKVKAVALAEKAIQLLPDNSISIDKIDWDGGVTDVIDGSAIADRSISNTKLEFNSITEFEIAPDAIGAAELKDLSVDTEAIQDAAVVDSKLASGINGNKLISGSVSADKIEENAIGSLQLADDSVDTNAIQAQAVTAAKLEPDLDGDSILAVNSVNLAIETAAITSTKLARDSVSTVKIQAGAVTDEKLASGIDGSKITTGTLDDTKLGIDSVGTNNIKNGAVTDEKLSGNIDGGKLNNGSVSPLAFPASAFSNGIKLDGTIQIDNEVAPTTANGIQYNAQGLIVGSSPLLNVDLPLATSTSVGGVSVPVDGGLTVSGTGAISIGNTINANTVNGISYNSHGLIIGSSPINSSDLPIATNTDLGGVIVPLANDNPLLVDGDGNLTFRVSPAGAGTYVNVTVDQYGLIQSGSSLLAANQVPPLDAGKIVSGEFGTARIANDAITMQKIADYGVSFIQEAQPTLNSEVLHIGCFWFQESTGQLRCYNGNSWNNVGFGRLSQDNLRFGGLVDADTGLVANLTDAGRTAGLKVGDAVPDPTDSLGGLYLVVSVPGSGINVDNVQGVAFDAGDWCLCINGQADGGWVRIDTLNGGGGGGGGAQRLNDLIDVDINNVQIGDTLIYSSNGLWTNRTTTADRVTISPAFDGATTSFTTSMDILDQNNIMLSVGGVMQEPGVDFSIESGTRQLNFATPPPTGSSYFLINQQTVNSSGGGGGGTTLPVGSAANEYLQWNNNTQSWVPSTELDGGVF